MLSEIDGKLCGLSGVPGLLGNSKGKIAPGRRGLFLACLCVLPFFKDRISVQGGERGS